MSRRSARGNRYGLVLSGVVLLAGGGLALARGLDAFTTTVPFGTPLPAAQPLLSAGETDYVDSQGWFWPVVGVLAVLVALLCLRWLVVQGRMERVREMQLEDDPTHGTTRVGSRAVTDAVTEELESYPGVHRASAHLGDDPDGPRLDLVVALERGADSGWIRERIRDEALVHVRQALDLDTVPALLTLAYDAAAAPRRPAVI